MQQNARNDSSTITQQLLGICSPQRNIAYVVVKVPSTGALLQPVILKLELTELKVSSVSGREKARCRAIPTATVRAHAYTHMHGSNSYHATVTLD